MIVRLVDPRRYRLWWYHFTPDTRRNGAYETWRFGPLLVGVWKAKEKKT